MTIQAEGRISPDFIRSQGIYRGKKSGRKVKVISAITQMVRYKYIYDNGEPMTAEQSMSREQFARSFVTQGGRVQEL